MNQQQSKISSILMGGLGNYLFQVSAAYAYGKKHSKQLVFNHLISSGPHNKVETYESNILNGVNLKGNIEFPTVWNESGFHHNEIPEIKANVMLNGYFQSEKYFLPYPDEIRCLFTSYDIEIPERISNVLKNYVTCAVHVRRGDFLKYPDHHPVQSKEYFIGAMDLMPKNCIFLIFSDDIAWCKSNLNRPNSKFIFIEGNKDYEDISIMRRCNHNIISNSTFSWWAAWLNSNKDKVVVAPRKWFGSAYSHMITSDLYCPGWEVI